MDAGDEAEIGREDAQQTEGGPSAVAWDDESRYRSCGDPTTPDGPMVFAGERFPALLGVALDRVAAYRWAGEWLRVPVQIDERRVIAWPDPQLLHVVRHGWDGVFDHDDDPAFDANDELVLPREAFGAAAPAGAEPPEGVLGAGVLVRYSPAAGEWAHAYVFRTETPGEDAAFSLVRYRRRDCFTDPAEPSFPCGTALGSAREDTWVDTPCYSLHYSMNWVLDALHVHAPAGGDGTDLIDRWKGRGFTSSAEAPFGGGGEHEDHRDQSGTGLCGWSEVDGSHYYVGHTLGPVRAIRMVRGACSYANTIRTSFFYRTHVVDHLLLRGHQVPAWSGGIGFYWDYSVAAAPLTYHREGAPPVALDGVPDYAAPNVAPMSLSALEAGTWEQVSSARGSLLFHTTQSLAFSAGATTNSFSVYLLDDLAHDDGTGEEPGLVGGHGLRFQTLQDTEKNPAGLRMVIRPAAANLPNVGSAFSSVLGVQEVVEVTEPVW
jgi:hypothetical protein